jgi:methionine-gamma-lyase
MNNPLLEIADIPSLAKVANEHGIKLVVDNTFTPMIFTPANLGANIVVNSLTKFINGNNDCVAGVICGTQEFINSLSNVNDGTAMLLGPVLDSFRSASILKNLHTLHIRMKKHSENAMYLAQKLSEAGVDVRYPGLKNHPYHEIMTKLMNKEFGYGGMLVINVDDLEKSIKLMEMMQNEKIGYLAVSLGFYKTLFSNPGSSTSSEIPEDVQREMGLTPGLIRFSVGLDNNIEKTYQRIMHCLKTQKII